MKNKELVLKLMKEIEIARKHYDAVMRAMGYATDGIYYNKTFSDDLLNALNHKELELWRQVFMFGLTLPAADQERIKAAAYEEFLAPDMSVREYITSGHQWLVSEEEEFREMARKLFMPNGDYSHDRERDDEVGDDQDAT